MSERKRQAAPYPQCLCILFSWLAKTLPIVELHISTSYIALQAIHGYKGHPLKNSKQMPFWQCLITLINISIRRDQLRGWSHGCSAVGQWQHPDLALISGSWVPAGG